LDIPISDPNTVFQAAREAHDARDWPRAVLLWEQARVLLSTHPLTFSEGAVALREAGDPVAAEAVIAEAMVRFPDFLGAFLVWADLAMRRRDWPEATTRWAELRRRFPKDGQGYVLGAQAFKELSRYDDADRVLEEGRRILPHDPWVMATWGYFAQHHRDTDEALRRFAEIRRNLPNHPVGYVTAAVTLRDQQRYQEAEATIASALARFPLDAGALFDWASIAQARGDTDEAIDRWRVVRDRFPDQGAGYVSGAALLRAAGRRDEAEALMTRALGRFPDNPHFHFDYGWAANARADWPEAVHRWAAIRTKFPNEPLPYTEGARALQMLDRFAESDALIAEAKARFPADLSLAIAWANLAMRRRDWAEAADRWLIVQQQFPNDVHAVLEGSRALQDAGRIDEAETMLAEAIQRFPDHAILAGVRAEIAMRRQMWAEAATRWATIRQRFPDNAPAYAEGAKALRQSGRLAEADALLTDAVRRFPTEPSVRFAWADAATSRTDWIEAHRRWEEVRLQLSSETRPWIESATALTNAARAEDADALLSQGIVQQPASLDIAFHWALHAARFQSAEVALGRWQRVRERFPDHTLGYTFGAQTLQDNGGATEAEALIAQAAERFPNNPDVTRTGAELAARRGELGVAATRFEAAAGLNPGDIAIMRRWIETLDALQRHDDARSALDEALRIWPRDREFLKRRVTLDIKTGHFDGAMKLWRSAIAMPDLADDLGHDIAWAIYSESPPPEMAREAMLYLIREKDTGTRDWLPRLAGMIQLRGLKVPLASLARQIVDTAPDAPCDRATMDVLRCALLCEYTDDDIRRFLHDYAAKGRVALTAHLFCQNYWKTKDNMFERFTAVFEQYLADKWHDLSWVREDNAAELLAYLNFAAVHSDAAYAKIVAAMRERLDLPAMQAQGLHTIQGAVANIALETRIDAPAIVTAPRRLRVAICVSGQLRGFQQAAPTWQNLRLDDHDVSVFVHVWKAIGRNWQRIWFFARGNAVLYGTLVGPNGLAFLRDRYPSLAAAAEAAAAQSNEADEPMLQSVYNTPHVRIEDDTREQFRNRHNLWKMHYKVDRAHRLALEDERSFDLMIRLRPDREFLPGTAPDWNAIHAQSRDRRTVFTDSPYLYTERQTWLGDQFAVGTQDAMDVYAGIYADMESFTRSGRFPPDVPDHIRPHTNLFYLCFYRGLLGRTMPDVTFGALLDPAMLSVSDVRLLVEQDVAGRALDDFDRQFIAACDAALAPKGG
jgi:tetratricopeptide (TPR) repeat protein